MQMFIGNFQLACPIPEANSRIWEKLPSNCDAIITKLDFVTDPNGLQELIQLLRRFWTYALSLDLMVDDGRKAIYHALYEFVVTHRWTGWCQICTTIRLYQFSLQTLEARICRKCP